MKKRLLTIVLAALIGSQVVFGQTNNYPGYPFPADSALTEVVVPRYFGGNVISGSNAAIMPTAVRLKISYLPPSVAFRVAVGINSSSQKNTPHNGGPSSNYMVGSYYIPGYSAGNNFFVCDRGITASEGVPSLNVLANAPIITSSASGEISFWAVLHSYTDNTGTIFDPLKNIWLSVVISNVWGSADLFSPATRMNSAHTLTTAYFANQTPVSDTSSCVLIEGHSYASGGKFVFAYDTPDGTGRPVHGYMIEDNSITENTPSGAFSGSYAPFYSANVAGQAGRYGILAPCDPAHRIKFLRIYNQDGSVYSEQSGVWPNSADNPDKGITDNSVLIRSTALNGQYIISEASAPLPVELTLFTAKWSNDKVDLNWKTETEVNFSNFVVERKSGDSWGNIATIRASGYSNSPKNYSFSDLSVGFGQKYVYRLKIVDNDATYKYSPETTVSTGVPQALLLGQNYPNPFNPSTKISYSLPIESNVILEVYDFLGAKVKTLVKENQTAGNYSIDFKADNLPSGVYVYQLRAGNFLLNKKMIIAK